MIAYGSVAGIVHRGLQPVPGETSPGRSRHTGRCKRVVLDGARTFGAVKDCALAIGCHPDSLSAALREGRRCRGHEVAYAEERPCR